MSFNFEKDIKETTVIEFSISTRISGSRTAEEFTLRDLGYTDGDFNNYDEFKTWLKEEHQNWIADNTRGGFSIKYGK